MNETGSDWSVEHYGFPAPVEQEPEPRSVPATRGSRRRSAWRSRAGIALGGGLLSLALVGGAGGYAVAQASTGDERGREVVHTERSPEGVARTGGPGGH